MRQREKTRTSIKDIVEDSQASTAAVSLTLNGDPTGRVAPATQDRIRESAKRLGYRSTRTWAQGHDAAYKKAEEKYATMMIENDSKVTLEYEGRRYDVTDVSTEIVVHAMLGGMELTVEEGC